MSLAWLGSPAQGLPQSCSHFRALSEGSVSFLTQWLVEDPVPHRLLPQGFNCAELLATDRRFVPCHMRLSVERLTTWYLTSSEQAMEWETEYDSKVEVTVFWNFITEVTSHHFCYILFFPSSLGLRKCWYFPCWHVQTHESKDLIVSYQNKKFLP